MRRLAQAEEVAQALGITPRAFAYRRRLLEQDHGFPAPVPGLGKRWDPAAVDAWLDAQRPQALAPVASMEEVLVRRARALAAV